jgi:hypothetical protein
MIELAALLTLLRTELSVCVYTKKVNFGSAAAHLLLLATHHEGCCTTIAQCSCVCEWLLAVGSDG